MTSLWRAIKDRGFTAIAAAACLLAILPLASIAWIVIKNGAPAITWSFLTHVPGAPDDPTSGIATAIVGTFVIVPVAMLLGIPLGMAGGIWLSEFGRGKKRGYWFRIALDAMAATPSIVVGIFVFTVVVLSQHHFSALAGAIALAFMMIPVVARTTEVAMQSVPQTLREAGIALGATHTRTLLRVALPAARGGVLTGAILATARVAGETAPLLFTALYAQNYATSLNKPIAALPTLIFNDIQQPYPQLQQAAWGAALLLFLLVFGANVIVRVVTRTRSRP